MAHYMDTAKHLFPGLREGVVVHSREIRPTLDDPRVKQALKWPGTTDQFLHLVCKSGDVRLEMLANYLEVLEVFQMIDINRSGGINQQELMYALHKNQAVVGKLGVPATHANALFNQIDTNNSGTISFVEFFRYFNASPLSKPFRPVNDYNHIISSMFKRIDVNGDGSISKDEFVKALKEDRDVQLELGWAGHMAELLFKFLDRDKSGDISANEFKLFCRAQWLFNNIDVNRSGYIDAVELGVALTKREIQRELDIPATRAKEVFTTMDQDGYAAFQCLSGQVRFSGFFRWLAARGLKDAPAEPAGRPTPPGRGGYTGHAPGARQASPPQAERQMTKEEEYKILEKVGEGQFGLVYTVQHYSGERLVKKVPKKSPQEDMKEFMFRMKEVQEEATMLARFKHPNVVRYIDSYTEHIRGDYTQDYKATIIITEYCPGGDLRKYYESRHKGGMAQPLATDVMLQVATAIEFLHNGNLLHRDLKPDNILLAGRPDRPVIKIGDFGLVKQLGEHSRDVAITKCGTPQYMAPEIMKNEPYGKPNDVWAVGCILHEVAKGAIAFAWPGPVGDYSLPKDTPSWCAAVVLAILQKDAKKRPSISQVRAWLSPKA